VEAKKPLFPEDAEAAKALAEERLRLFMKPEVIPDDVRSRMIALDNRLPRGKKGERVRYHPQELTWSATQEVVDRIVAQYQVDDLAIYWEQNASALEVAVRPAERKPVTELDDKRKLCDEMAKRLFGFSDSPIPSVHVPTQMFWQEPHRAWGYVLVGKATPIEAQPGVFQIQKDRDLANQAHNLLLTATDGLNVRFWSIVTDPHWRGPSDDEDTIPDWF
jgi:hypothetical protein